jgi:hypothetical protein
VHGAGFVHSIPDSFESFDEVMEQSDASEMTRDYAWPAWIAMMGVIICFSVEELVDFLAAHFRVAHAHSHAHSHKKGEPALVEDDDEEDDIEAKKELAEKESTDEAVQNSKSEKTKKEKTSKDYTPATRRMVKMLVLFFGLLFHVRLSGMLLQDTCTRTHLTLL